jgi:hypothetical protein
LFDGHFILGVRAPMCVGLASPELRALITLECEEIPLTLDAQLAEQGPTVS